MVNDSKQEDADRFVTRWANYTMPDSAAVVRGGEGSGFKDHRGRPGQQGGSLPRDAGNAATEKPYRPVTARDNVRTDPKKIVVDDGYRSENNEEMAFVDRVAKGRVEYREMWFRNGGPMFGNSHSTTPEKFAQMFPMMVEWP